MCVEPTDMPQQKQGLGIWVVMTLLKVRYGRVFGATVGNGPRKAAG